MAKKSKLFTLAAVAGAAVGFTCYYLQKQAKKAEENCDAYDDFDDFDDFDSSDLTEDDFVDESESLDAEDETAAEDNSKASEDDKNKGIYISLDFKDAQKKAGALCSAAAGAFSEAITKIKQSEEYSAVAESITDTVHKIKNSDEFKAGEDHLESALHFVKEATDKAVDKVSEKLDSIRPCCSDVCDADKYEAEFVDSTVITPASEECAPCEPVSGECAPTECCSEECCSCDESASETSCDTRTADYPEVSEDDFEDENTDETAL